MDQSHGVLSQVIKIPINYFRHAQSSLSKHQAQFTDKNICSTNHNFDNLIGCRQTPQSSAKQKLSQIVYNIKSSEIYQKYQDQKRQALKKQWLQLKNQSQLQQNHHKNNSFKRSNLVNTKKMNNTQKFTKGHENSSLFTDQIQKIKQIPQNEQEKRKRSKTQMLIYDYELQKIGPLKLVHNLQKQCFDFGANQDAIKQNSKHKINADRKKNTLCVKSDQFTLVKTQKKSESQIQKKCLNAYSKSKYGQNVQTKDKLNKYSMQHYQAQKHCYSRSRNPMSKSVMVQKIINLRKTFNDKYKKSPKKSFIQNSWTHSAFNQSRSQPKSNESNNNIILFTSFPVMTLTDTKKIGFQQLFQQEKRKMELLKKFVKRTGILNSFNQQQREMIAQMQKLGCQEEDQDQLGWRNLTKLSNSHSLLLQQKDNRSESCQSKKIRKKQNNGYDLPGEQLKKINSHSNILQQNFLNVNSISILQNKKELQVQQFEQCVQKQKSQNQNGITTYGFNQMNKPIQRPQIKSLRSQYLYSTKQKMTKQIISQNLFSIITVHDKQQSNLKKWKLKYKTQPVMDQCLQIERKIPQNWDRIGKTAANFIKGKIQKQKRSFSKEKHLNQFAIKTKTNTASFEPWENELIDCIQELEIDDFVQS